MLSVEAGSKNIIQEISGSFSELLPAFEMLTRFDNLVLYKNQENILFSSECSFTIVKEHLLLNNMLLLVTDTSA